MDKIIISDLLVRGIIGINDWERKRAQDILINVILFSDTHRAAETDSIVDCVNYSTMSKRLQAQCAVFGPPKTSALVRQRFAAVQAQ